MAKRKQYIFYEIGDSCRTEIMSRDGEFQCTEDAVVIGIAEGKDVKDAFRNLTQESPWIENYKLDRLVAREAGKAVYLKLHRL